MRGTLSAIDQECLMTDLTHFAQQSCAFTLQFQFTDQAKCTDKVIFKALALVHEPHRPTFLLPFSSW